MGRKINPQSPKAFQYLCPVILAHYISSLYDGAEESRESRGRRGGRAQGSAWAGELGQYFYKCPSEYGQCWIPCSLVVSSVPQILPCMNTAKRRDLLHTNHTVLISQQTKNCSMSSAHEQFVHYLVQRKKCFLECLCMNLNFKLFLFFLLKAQTYFERKVM